MINLIRLIDTYVLKNLHLKKYTGNLQVLKKKQHSVNNTKLRYLK